MKRLITTTFIAFTLLASPVLAQAPHDDHKDHRHEHREHRHEHREHRHDHRHDEHHG